MGHARSSILVAICRIFSCGIRILSCGMWDLKFSDWGSNPVPLLWEHGVLATGTTREVPGSVFLTFPGDVDAAAPQITPLEGSAQRSSPWWHVRVTWGAFKKLPMPRAHSRPIKLENPGEEPGHWCFLKDESKCAAGVGNLWLK